MADITLFATNNLNIKDGSDAVATLNKTTTITAEKEYVRNKDVLNPAVVPVPLTLDYSTITAPKYLKLTADGYIDITIGTDVISNVTSFELNGVIPTIIVTNNSTTDKVIIDYIVLGS